MKESLHLIQESILFLGKYNNQSLALPLKEKGNNLSLIISPSTSLYFFHLTKFNKIIKVSGNIISTSTRKLLFHHKIQQSRFNFIESSFRKRCSNKCDNEVIVVCASE